MRRGKVRVGLGLASFPLEDARSFFRWALRCEELRIDSLWQTDRLVSADPYLEPLSAVATLAGMTERVKFGMNAVVAPLRDPLVLAKQCATIDFLSRGRLLPMFGVGNDGAPEWLATGREPKTRGSVADEVLELLRRLWSEDSVTFEGRHFRYREARIAPRPVQQPMPLWIGGQSAAAIRRTARLGNGWIGGIASVDQVEAAIRGIRSEAAALGRAIDDDHFGASLAFRIGSFDDAPVGRHPLLRRSGVSAEALRSLVCVGGSAELVARIEALKAVGASKFVLIPIADGDADLLDQTERIAAEVVPAVQEG
ncbi:MAG TPA: TIGR03619 family F420-dependent LLM class oxidoreductase [Myxococcota bacterium]|jgi:probable F420-dependent oxidoreductase|nr:TIGR03619 family F420-dependent LLM class oxidoreductase [Myxococcota bacterium]